MRGKSRIMWRNAVPQASSVAATSAQSGYPAIMLQDLSPSMLWKSTGLADQVITVSWSVPQIVGAVCLANHNLTWKGTITISDGSSSETFDAWEPIWRAGYGPAGRYPIGGYPSAENLAGFGGHPLRIIYLARPLLTSSLTVTMHDPDNSAGYVRLGGLFAGPYLEPSVQFSSDHSMGSRDKSEGQEMPGGQQEFVVRPRLRRRSVTYEHLPELVALQGLLAMLQTVGTSAPFYFDAFSSQAPSVRYWYAGYYRREDEQDLAMSVMQRGQITLNLIEHC